MVVTRILLIFGNPILKLPEDGYQQNHITAAHNPVTQNLGGVQPYSVKA